MSGKGLRPGRWKQGERNGVYRFSRNPMYVAYFICFMGMALLVQSLVLTVDEIIDGYLKHITDVKPITARQCIKLLPMIAKDKPELRNDICSALDRVAGRQTMQTGIGTRFQQALQLQREERSRKLL